MVNAACDNVRDAPYGFTSAPILGCLQLNDE